MQYYLKKCGHQELGSVGPDGKAHRGRYLLTSMDARILNFFPPLSQTQLNDSALLPIISLISGKKVYCNFVYHNNKFHGSMANHPRNEYRLYLNKGIEENTLLFKKDDIVIIRKGDYNEDDQEIQKVYYLDKIEYSNNIELYSKLNNIILNSDINGGYGIYDGVIDEFERKVKEISYQAEVIIDKSVTDKIEKESSISSLFDQSSFRDFVMVGYKNLCAITGTVIRSENFMNLEAAHIKPKSHGGLYLPNNGIALSRDLHWAFDKGFFTIDDSYKIVVHKNIDSAYLKSYDGQQIRLPEDNFFKPNLENLEYHRKNVFGLFMTSGRL